MTLRTTKDITTTNRIVEVSEMVTDNYALEVPLLNALLKNVKETKLNTVEKYVRRLDTDIDTSANVYGEGSTLKNQSNKTRYKQKKISNNVETYREEISISDDLDIMDPGVLTSEVDGAVGLLSTHLEKRIIFGDGEDTSEGYQTIKGIVEFLPEENKITINKNDFKTDAAAKLKEILKVAKCNTLNAVIGGYDAISLLDNLVQNITTNQGEQTLFYGNRVLQTNKGLITPVLSPAFDMIDNGNCLLFIDTRKISLYAKKDRLYAVSQIVDSRLDGKALQLMNKCTMLPDIDPSAFVFVEFTEGTKAKTK